MNSFLLSYRDVPPEVPTRREEWNPVLEGIVFSPRKIIHLNYYEETRGRPTQSCQIINNR